MGLGRLSFERREESFDPSFRKLEFLNAAINPEKCGA